MTKHKKLIEKIYERIKEGWEQDDSPEQTLVVIHQWICEHKGVKANLFPEDEM